ncbi:hypothetical protein [Nostoc sp. CCY 9925]|uniref:hypothetical protein n=1 Tax=Nostoc sp. CCY 9925 TaxID=3103865 RepID=UPI0039C74C8E
MAAGIDILELRRLEASGIPTDLALELMAIAPKVADGTTTAEEAPRIGQGGRILFTNKN